jgi:hypothetical protein
MNGQVQEEIIYEVKCSIWILPFILELRIMSEQGSRDRVVAVDRWEVVVDRPPSCWAAILPASMALHVAFEDCSKWVVECRVLE